MPDKFQFMPDEFHLMPEPTAAAGALSNGNTPKLAE
jgi:hypothetical protein